MFDVKINEQGSCVIQRGDFVKTTFEEYVAQVIYGVMMQVSLELLSGKRVSDVTAAQEEIRAYIVSKLSGNSLIDTSGISVVIGDAWADSCTFGIYYKGYNPETAGIVEYTSPFTISVKGGAYTSVALFPETYTSATLGSVDHAVDVQVPVIISEQTKDVRLPGIPSCLVYGNDIGPEHLIYLSTTSAFSLWEEVISVTLQPEIKVYPLSRKATGMVVSAQPTNLPEGASLVLVNGEHALFYRGPVTAEAICTVVVTTAQAVTGTVSLTPSTVESVYPLAPLRSSVIAHFDRTLQPGTYVVQYKELREV